MAAAAFAPLSARAQTFAPAFSQHAPLRVRLPSASCARDAFDVPFHDASAVLPPALTLT